MALIACKDCNNKVSSSAVACPKCGAPVENTKTELKPKYISENTTECPFCMIVLNSQATVCSGCGAHKGYSVSPSGSVRSKLQHISSLILFVVIGFVLSIFTYKYYNNIGFYLGLFFIVIFFLGLLGIKKGPRWFQKRGPS